MRLTQRRWRKQGEHNTIARAVAFEDLALHQRIARIRAKLLAHLLLGLAERQRLWLREEVAQEDAVML